MTEPAYTISIRVSAVAAARDSELINLPKQMANPSIPPPLPPLTTPPPLPGTPPPLPRRDNPPPLPRRKLPIRTKLAVTACLLAVPLLLWVVARPVLIAFEGTLSDGEVKEIPGVWEEENPRSRLNTLYLLAPDGVCEVKMTARQTLGPILMKDEHFIGEWSLSGRRLRMSAVGEFGRRQTSVIRLHNVTHDRIEFTVSFFSAMNNRKEEGIDRLLESLKMSQRRAALKRKGDLIPITQAQRKEQAATLRKIVQTGGTYAGLYGYRYGWLPQYRKPLTMRLKPARPPTREGVIMPTTATLMDADQPNQPLECTVKIEDFVLNKNLSRPRLLIELSRDSGAEVAKVFHKRKLELHAGENGTLQGGWAEDPYATRPEHHHQYVSLRRAGEP